MFAWYGTVKELIHQVHDTDVLDKLWMTLQHLGSQPAVGDMGPSAQEQYDALQTLRSYTLELAACHAWNHAIYTICLPYLFCCIHHKDLDQRRVGMQRIQEVWESILRAEAWEGDEKLSPVIKKALRQLMADLAFHKAQLSREIYESCRRENWAFDSEELREFSFLVFATPANTKFYLEDCFSHLSDVTKRFARHHKLTKWLKYFYMNTVPSHDDLEWDKLEPSYRDFLAAINRRATLCREACAKDQDMASNSRVFSMTEKFTLPQALNFTPSNLKKTEKNAGPFSNQVMTAATAFLMNIRQPTDGIEKAWAGNAKKAYALGALGT
ncbi:unnamed protein product [Symbiodinium necroappetens]|uniref:Uncharacterized protein n=1 Tax=Symbiodinium necroappetens TaxID=1628268 RepID=A0A813CAX4_9DINO|nr:unnamed protein product [Symbiodinium necroappetens]